MSKSTSSSTLAQPAVTITIPAALQKTMIPSSSEAPPTSSSSGRNGSSSTSSSSHNTGTPAYFHNGQLYVLPSTSTTLRNLSVATFIDGYVSAVGETFINRVLIRKEDLAAFSVDVVATYPAIAAEYEKLCPRMLDLGTMKSNLTAPLPASSAELSRFILMKDGDDGVVSEKYAALLLKKITSDITSNENGGDAEGENNGNNNKQLVQTATLPLVVAMFSACYPRMMAAKISSLSSSSKGAVTSRVSTRGRNINNNNSSEDAGVVVTPTDSTVGAFSSSSALLVDEQLLEACSEWLKANVIEPITSRLSDQVELIAENCLTFNSSNTNTFFVDHAAELKTFTVQKALPAFRARWQEFLCTKWLRNSVVIGVIGDLVKQYKEGSNIASPNTSSSLHEYLKPAPVALSQQFVETPPLTQNLSQKTSSSTAASQPHKSLFKKGATATTKSSTPADNTMPSVSLSAHFDSVQQQGGGGGGSKAASSTGSIGLATTAQSRQERNRLLQAMSPATKSTTTKAASSSVVTTASSPEAIFKVPEVLRSFLVAKHLHRGAIAAQLAATNDASSSDLTDLFGKPSNQSEKVGGTSINPYSVFASTRKSMSTSTDDEHADGVAFVCDAALEKRFASETVAQVLERFYCHRVTLLKKKATTTTISKTEDENKKEAPVGDNDNTVVSNVQPTSSFERAQALHNQTALRELRELLELILNVFEKAVSMPVLLYSFEMSELYRSQWWAQASSTLYHGGGSSSSSLVKAEGAAQQAVIGTKRVREDDENVTIAITPLSFKSKSDTTTSDESSSASWQFAQVCSCEYLVRLLVWLPQIVKVMLGGGGGASGGGAQWAAAALASQVVTPLVEELLEWIHNADDGVEPTNEPTL